MWCAECQSELVDCTCTDLAEQLERAIEGGHFTYRVCRKCEKHYARCRCENPDFYEALPKQRA